MSDIKTITTDDLWLPGDELGGALLRGWCGPLHHPSHLGPLLWQDPHGDAHAGYSGRSWYLPDDASRGLDCTRSEVRDRIVRVLMARERCPECDGGMVMCGLGTLMAGPGECPDCNGSGYTRPPVDLLWLHAAELRGEVSAVEAAGILWCSVLRVGAGWGAVHGLQAATSPGRFQRVAGKVRLGSGMDRPADVVGDHYAVLEPDAIVLPHPDAVCRLETDND